MAKKLLTDLNANGNKITNLPTTPAGTNDAASKAYVDTKEPAITAGTTAQYWRGDKTWQTLPTGGSGDVVGPASAVNNSIAVFSGTTGKIIADGGKTLPTGAIVGISDTQTFTGKSFNQALLPSATGTHAIGSGTLMWTNLFLQAAGVINFGNGDLTLTKTSTRLEIAGTTGAVMRVPSIGAFEIGSDTALTRVSAGVLAVAGVTVPTETSTNTLTNKTITDNTNLVPFRRVIHGATAGTARPNATHVEWVGSVTPTNANTTLDTWIDTA